MVSLGSITGQESWHKSF